MVFFAFALSSLKEFRLLVKGTFLNLRRAAFRRRIAILHSLLNQGVLRLFDGVAINVSIKCFIRTQMFGSWTSLLLNKFLNWCQSALFVFQQGGLLLSWIGCDFQYYGEVVTAAGIIMDLPCVIYVAWRIR